MDQAMEGSTEQVDAAMRRILRGEGDADIAEQGERLRAQFAELRETALQVKKERDLAISALKVARLSLHNDDPVERLETARLLAQTLRLVGEEAL